jgi:hypothetical protein
MRLLLCSETGKLSFTKEFAGDDVIPHYAILAHAWGPDAEEVIFEDLSLVTLLTGVAPSITSNRSATPIATVSL